MYDIELARQESDGQIYEYIVQIELTETGEGAAIREACGGKLREGASLVVFTFQSGERPAFLIGYLKCVDCRHEPMEYFTLSVCKLVLEGRVDTCSDSATQLTWPVLLAPQPHAVSLVDTTTVQPCDSNLSMPKGDGVSGGEPA